MAYRRHRVRIYTSVWHIVATFSFLVLPFVFIVVFSEVTKVATLTLLAEMARSVWRLFLSYLIAATLAWGSAVLFNRGKASQVALPLFDVLQSFPTFAALPLATFIWGRTDTTVIIFLVITIIWPIFFSILSSLRLVKHDWEESAEMVGLRGFDYLRLYLWPVSIPGLITGSIIGLGEGWEAMVATEIIVNIQDGLGGYFQMFSHDTLLTTLGIAGLLLLIFSINKIVWIPLLDWSHKLMEE